MHILAVDDSPIIRKLIEKALEPEGFMISEAKNGKEAVELYPKLKPDLITMDVTMPVMDGITAAKRIRRINPNQKIIMLSAMGDKDLIAEARACGITDFFSKPFKASEIITKIRQIT